MRYIIEVDKDKKKEANFMVNYNYFISYLLSFKDVTRNSQFLVEMSTHYQHK